MGHHQIVHILVVEDSDTDVILMERTFRKNSFPAKLHRVRNGNEAMAFLRDGENIRPDVIFLDLRMPEKDGREVLGELRVDPNLHAIPVVVLTSSAAETDIARSYTLGAAAYVTKPIDLDDVEKTLSRLGSFWTQETRYPGT